MTNADELSFLPVYALGKCVKSFPMMKSLVILHVFLSHLDDLNFVISVSEDFHDPTVWFHIQNESHWVGKMPPKEHMIHCLECNIVIDFDHRKKHKAICYNVIISPRNPLEAVAGKSSNLSKTITSNDSPDSSSNVIKKIFEVTASLWNFHWID